MRESARILETIAEGDEGRPIATEPTAESRTISGTLMYVSVLRGTKLRARSFEIRGGEDLIEEKIDIREPPSSLSSFVESEEEGTRKEEKATGNRSVSRPKKKRKKKKKN